MAGAAQGGARGHDRQLQEVLPAVRIRARENAGRPAAKPTGNRRADSSEDRGAADRPARRVCECVPPDCQHARRAT